MADIYRKIGFDVSSALTSIDKLNSAIKQLSANMKQVGGSAGGFGNIRTAMERAVPATYQFSNGAKTVIKSLDDLVRQSQHAAAGMKGIAPGLNGAATGFAGLKEKISGFMGAVAPIAATAKSLFSSLNDAAAKAASFGIKIAQIQTIGDELRMSNEQLSQSILGISSAYGIAAGDVAEGVYQILSNQVVEAGQSFAFMEEAAKLATVGVGTTSDAIDTMSSVINAYNLDAGQMERVSGTLFRAVDLGRFQLKDLSDTLGRVTPVAAQAGVSWEEVASALAVMTQQGVRADTAITQLRAILTKIIKPTEALQQLYVKWGVKDGPTAIATFGGLQGVLRKLQEETKGSTAELGTLFNEVRGLAGALALNVDGGRKFNSVLAEISDSTGAVSEKFNQFINTDAKAYQKVVESLKNAWIEFGQSVLKVVPTLLTFGEAFLRGGTTILNFMQKLTAEALGFSTAFEKGALAASDANLQKRLAEVAKESTKGAFDQPGASASLQQFNQAMVQRLQAYNQAARGVQSTQDNILRSFAAYTQSIMSQFTSAVNAVESRLKALPGLIQKTNADIQSADTAIQDEELRQKLSRADGNASQEARILREDADKKYWEARKALQNKNLNEETAAEAKAVLDRAIASQRSLETAAKGAGDVRGERDAQARILELLKEQKSVAELTKKNLLNEQNLLNKAIGEMKRTELEVNTLIKERIKLAKEYRKAIGSGDREAAESIGQKLDENSQKIVDTGKNMSKEAGAALDKVLGEGAGTGFQQALRQQLPQASTDMQTWMTEQQDKLSRMQWSIEVTPEMNLGQLLARLKEMGTVVDEQDVMGTITRAQTQGKVDESAFQEARKELEQAQITLNARAEAAQKAAQDVDAQINRMGKAAPEAVSAMSQLYEQMALMSKGVTVSPESLESTRQALIAAKGEVVGANDNLIERGQLLLETIAQVAEAKAKLEESDAKVAATGEKSLAGRFLLDAATQSATIKTNTEGTANALTTWTDPVARLNELLDGTNNRVTTVQQNTANIGASGNQAAIGVGAISTALDGVIQKAALAAQAVAAIGSGAGAAAGAAAPPQHFGGRYFARGGLGMLAPRGTDTIPAMIQRGEFVVNKKSAGKYFSQLTAMNNGLQPLYRREGGSVTNVGDVNVTVQGGDTSRQTVRAIARELRHELKRGTIRFN